VGVACIVKRLTGTWPGSVSSLSIACMRQARTLVSSFCAWSYSSTLSTKNFQLRIGGKSKTCESWSRFGV
jgi:hypothetical protein